MKALSKLLLVLFFFNLFVIPVAQASPIKPEQFNYLIGKENKQPWFEWWYTKVTVPETRESFFITLGTVIPEKHLNRTSTAFVSIGDFDSKYIATKEYALNEFSASTNSLDVKLGETKMNGEHFSGRVGQHAFNFKIQKRWGFNAMGWGMFVPNITNIGWYPAQADAVCTGTFETLDQNGKPKTIQFTNAPCYQDRNWGKSFPSWWAWIVSNKFKEDPQAALAVGGGRPKILNHEFYEGVSIGLRYQNKIYTFRPNDLAKIKAEICFGKWKVEAENKTHRIEIEAYAPPEAFMDLPFLTPQGTTFHDLETLTGNLTVKLYERTPHGDLNSVTTLTSSLAGIEYGDAKGQTKKQLFGRCRSLQD